MTPSEIWKRLTLLLRIQDRDPIQRFQSDKAMIRGQILFILRKIKRPWHIMEFRVATGFHSSSHMTTHSTGMFPQVPRKGSSLLDHAEDSTSGNTSLPRRQNIVYSVWNSCDRISPKIYPPNSHDCNTLDHMWCETKNFLCHTKDELKSIIIVALSNLNKEHVGMACRRLQSHLEAVGVSWAISRRINFIYIVFQYIFMKFWLL